MRIGVGFFAFQRFFRKRENINFEGGITMNLKSRKIISMALVFFMMLTILPLHQ